MMRRPIILIALGLTLTLLAAPPAPSPVARAAPPDLPAALYFPDTGQAVRGAFLEAWIEFGMTDLVGSPLTAELVEDGRTVQYFEFARLERAGSRAPVVAGPLGREAVADWSRPAFTPLASGAAEPERRYFAETGHTLAYSFRRFWERRGGLARFGPPISEELAEGGRTVQYFERVRFVYAPEGGAFGTDVALSPLGRLAALRRGHLAAPVDRLSEEGGWAPALRPAEAVEWAPAVRPALAAWLRARLQAAAQARVTPIAPVQVAVAVPEALTYWAPAPAALDAGPVYARHIYLLDGVATGESVDGADRWYRLALDGSFIPAAEVQPFAPPPPPRTWPGRWVDVNLSTFYLTVYDGDQPLRSALITAGRKNRTPTGVFYVQRRVRSETMNSATVGIFRGHPEYYYLTNVEYTQYFTGAGHAIHGNYWVHPSRFGQFISNGCIGLRTHDAAWVWALTTAGTPVSIHY